MTFLALSFYNTRVLDIRVYIEKKKKNRAGNAALPQKYEPRCSIYEPTFKNKSTSPTLEKKIQ